MRNSWQRQRRSWTSLYRRDDPLEIFYKNKGTISVFLTLILLPVLLFGGMTVDASRIYMSKAVISDAGEMAMNAGLAQYNEALHDVYGLLAMDEAPEDMESELEAYFEGSLNGMGLPGAEDYDKILDLIEKEFEAVNVDGSQIYKTEVEKQQILEYMKYRAPVCLIELVNDKMKELKNVKKMSEALEAQVEFSEAMEDCQEGFEAAKSSLDGLNDVINGFPSADDIKKELSGTEQDYKNVAARGLLIRAAIQTYSKKATGTDMKELIEQYIASAEKVDLSDLYSGNTFESYIDSMYYKNAIDALGGIDNVSDKEKKELEDLIKEYKKQQERIGGYVSSLFEVAMATVKSHSETLSSYRNTAEAAETAAAGCYEKLSTLKEKLEAAAGKLSKWSDKVDALNSAGGEAGSMNDEVKEYKELLSGGDGKKSLEDLKDLMSKVEEDKNYFGKWKQILEEEKFFEKSIAMTGSQDQLNEYNNRAKNSVKEIEAAYSSIENAREAYVRNYKKADTTNPYSKQSLQDPEDGFYKKLKEYCKGEKEETKEGKEAKEKADGNLNKSKDAGADAANMEGYPKFDWSKDSGVAQLPSAALKKAAAEDAKAALTDLKSDGNVKGNRKNILKKYKESLQAATTFLDKVDKIVEGALENLYIAEYAMQMFSYYTVGMEDGKEKAEADIISISGYGLKDREAYLAECEYILWGRPKSQENIRNTIMMLFGVRLLFNSFFAFTDAEINLFALASASALVGWAPYLIPGVKAVIKFGLAGVETANDIEKLKQGYGVTIAKNTQTWATGGGDNTKGITFDYSEYLRVFLNISLLAGKETGILGRIADCIQVNEPETDLMASYTMIAIRAEVGARTTFMRKISDWGGGGTWGFPDDSYTIAYESVLGY